MLPAICVKTKVTHPASVQQVPFQDAAWEKVAIDIVIPLTVFQWTVAVLLP